MASVAMANSVNANLVRRWVLESERGVPEEIRRAILSHANHLEVKPGVGNPNENTDPNATP